MSCGPADRSFGDELRACHGFDVGRGVAQAQKQEAWLQGCGGRWEVRAAAQLTSNDEDLSG